MFLETDNLDLDKAISISDIERQERLARSHLQARIIKKGLTNAWNELTYHKRDAIVRLAWACHVDHLEQAAEEQRFKSAQI
jgi:hypothetical protein